jgi:NNP family nitrate/nitrite transporter-like MFS transporter
MNPTAPTSGTNTSLSVALPLAFVAVFMAFACWTLLAVSGVHLKQSLGLSSTEFGLLVGAPILVSGLLALPFGLLVRAIGGRLVIVGCLAGVSLVLVVLMQVQSYSAMVSVAGGLGLSIGLFISALRYVVTQASPAHMGVALGCCGAGISGAGFSYLVVPLIHEAYRWQVAPMAYILILGLTLVLTLVLTDSDRPPVPRPPVKPTMLAIRYAHPRSFGVNYSILFGGFVALILWLPDYLSAQYDLSLKTSAMLATLFVGAGAVAQIFGGALADQHGTPQVLRWALLAALALLLVFSYPHMQLEIKGVDTVYELELKLPLALAVVLLTFLGAAMGLGLGGLLRQLYHEFPRSIGIGGGATLSAACFLAFVLPLLFGLGNDLAGVRSIAFMLLFGMTLISLGISEWTIRVDERERLMEQNQDLTKTSVNE